AAFRRHPAAAHGGGRKRHARRRGRARASGGEAGRDGIAVAGMRLVRSVSRLRSARGRVSRRGGGAGMTDGRATRAGLWTRMKPRAGRGDATPLAMWFWDIDRV